jgi:hypothetical protein
MRFNSTNVLDEGLRIGGIGLRHWRRPGQPPFRGPRRWQWSGRPQRALRRPQLQVPLASSCCGCPEGGRASEEPLASPPGPWPCFGSQVGGRACACLTRRRLRPRPHWKLRAMTLERKGGETEATAWREEGVETLGSGEKPSRAPRFKD